MTPEELRSAELREKFRGHDPDEVEGVLTKWAAAIEQGERLSLADLMEQRFRPRFRGYDPGEVKALIERPSSRTSRQRSVRSVDIEPLEFGDASSQERRRPALNKN